MSTVSALCFPRWDQTDLEDGTHIIALKILEVDRERDLDRKETWQDGYWLLLKAVKNRGEYVRVGILAPEGRGGHQPISVEFRDVMEEEAVEGEFKII